MRLMSSEKKDYSKTEYLSNADATVSEGRKTAKKTLGNSEKMHRKTAGTTFGEITESLFYDSDFLLDLADIFKVFGDATRLKILLALTDTELRVYDIAEAVDMTQSAVSHQLKILKQSHLVKNRRVGKSIIYSIKNKNIEEIILNVIKLKEGKN